MKIDVEEDLIEHKERNSTLIDQEINEFLDNDEGQNIKNDIELLKSMGFEKKMINKVYILLRPENIERAIDYMTEIDGIYQHNFISSSNRNEKSLCFICKKPINNHLDYIPSDLLTDAQLDMNLINNNRPHIIENIEEDNIVKDKDDSDFTFNECDVCYEEMNNEQKNYNKVPCGHMFCTHCWNNYLKTLILEAKVDKIKCMDHECKEIISEEFILTHISGDNNLVEKYYRFKKRAEILKDKNKKLCPNPDCDSFLQKSKLSKYVKCENGHKYCFDCLKPPHGKKSCDFNIEKQFMDWKKGKRVKRCPRCKIYTEKNEGCNHMTCVSCKYQWCWLCEGEYKYGHYDSGKCSGQQFTRADNLKEIKRMRNGRSIRVNYDQNVGIGLHRIFKRSYPPIKGPIDDFDNELCLKYFFMIMFWIFGFLIIEIFIVVILSEDYMAFNRNSSTIFFKILISCIAISLFAAFEIFFTSLITPFILISLVYHPFFPKLLLLFGLGNDSV